MASLILMRHAKAVDRLEAEDDFERGLTERGRADAARAAAAISQSGLGAAHALVSPARRTRETWMAIAEVMGAPPVNDPMALYHASDVMLERLILEAIEHGHTRLVLVGHNPGVGALAHFLAARAGRAAALPQGWPTSAAAGFHFTTSGGAFETVELAFLFNPKP